MERGRSRGRLASDDDGSSTRESNGSVQAVGLTETSDRTRQLILSLSKVFIALVLLAVRPALGNYIKDLLSGMVEPDKSLSVLVTRTARIALISFAGSMALQQVGIGDKIVTNAFTILFGAVRLAAALAVGLGSKDVVGQYLKYFKESADKNRKA